MQKPKIIPAVLAHTAKAAQKHINRLRVLKTPIHLDLMDGRFVTSRSFGPKVLTTLRLPHGSTAHLLVRDPGAWVGACTRVGITSLVVHVESNINSAFIKTLKKRFTIFLGINPETSINKLTPLIPYINGILVMTVYPGKQGRPFVSKQLGIIRKLHRRFTSLPIMVDGGVNEKTIGLALRAGGRLFVIGSAIIQSENVIKTFKKLQELVQL